jgi:serine/threonine-protein kinase
MPTTGYAATAATAATPSEPEASAQAFAPGQVLRGTYRLIERMAAGGMGEVYAAEHERLPARVAVKVLHRELRGMREAVARFGREALIMAGLHHPHIAQVFDFDVTEEGTPYLVMELLEGTSLQQFVDRRQPMAPAKVATIVRQIASALGAAHARGVVHRDLKPENVILLRAEGHEAFVKVFDFGISKVAWSNHPTRESAILGTPEYMSPEQAAGRPESIDHRTDQFALAAMAYALLTGRPPFAAETPLGVLYQVVNREVTPLRELVDWPAAAAGPVLARAMAKQADDRYPDIGAFARALEQALAVAAASSSRTRRRPGRLVALAAVVLAAALGLGAGFVAACGGWRPAASQAGHLWRVLGARVMPPLPGR